MRYLVISIAIAAIVAWQWSGGEQVSSGHGAAVEQGDTGASVAHDSNPD